MCRTLQPLDRGAARVVGLGFGPLGFRVWESAGLLQEILLILEVPTVYGLGGRD